MALSSYLSKLTKPINQTHIRTITSSPQSNPSFRTLKNLIKSEKDPIKLASLFESSLSIPTFRRYKPLFTLSVHKLALSKRFDLIDHILTKTIVDSKDPLLGSEGFWLRIAMLYSQSGMVENALKVFDEMLERAKREFSEKSLCGVVSVMLDNKIHDENLDKTFDRYVSKMGVKPGVKAYNLLLKGYVKGGRLDEGEELVRKMESEFGLKPDVFTYNVLLGGYLGSGKRIAFDAVTKRMQEKYVKDNLTTINHRIMMYCKIKQCARAKKLLDEMRIKKKILPDSSSYGAIIFGFCKVGDLESARTVLNNMVNDGYVKETSFAYYTVMKHMVQEGEFDSALEICKDIIRKKWVPPFEATKVLVEGLVKNSKTDDAKEIVGSFKKQLRGTALESWGKIEATLPI